MERHGTASPCDGCRAESGAVERRIVAWLRAYADEAEKVPGPEQYEDALRSAADLIEQGDHLREG